MKLVGYEQVEKICEVAVYAREHVMLLGAPGTGKSLFARCFFARFEGELFMTQLSRWSDEVTLFGPPDFKALRNEGVLRWKPGGLLTATWAFIDEMFDASDVLLRTLLGVLNEREFRRGAFAVQVPLESVIATSNYQRINEVTAAVIDRFAFIIEAPRLSAEQRLVLWHHFSNPHSDNNDGEKIPLSRIWEIRKQACSVTIPDEVARLGSEFAVRLGFSPRREAKVAWVTKVHAALNLRRVVMFDDLLAVFPYMILPSDGGDLAARRREIEEEMKRHIDIICKEQQQLQAIAALVTENVPSTIEELREITRRIRSLRELQPVSEKVERKKTEVLNKLQYLHAEGLSKLGVVV